jgi:hypothetical protein
MPEFNWLAAIVAGLWTYALGFLWYSPILLGKPYAKAVGLDPASPGGYSPAVVFGVGVVLALIASINLAAFLGPKPDLAFAVAASTSVGLCWTSTSYAIQGFFERKPVTLMLINAGFETVRFAGMGLILGLWH